jgi:hypothetical protein
VEGISAHPLKLKIASEAVTVVLSSGKHERTTHAMTPV